MRLTFNYHFCSEFLAKLKPVTFIWASRSENTRNNYSNYVWMLLLMLGKFFCGVIIRVSTRRCFFDTTRNPDTLLLIVDKKIIFLTRYGSYTHTHALSLTHSHTLFLKNRCINTVDKLFHESQKNKIKFFSLHVIWP